LFDVGSGEAPEAGFVASGNQFGQGGSGRDGSRTAANLISALGDAPTLDQNGEAEDIAAYGVRNLNRDRRRRKFTHIARIPEMFDQFRGHRPIVTSGSFMKTLKYEEVYRQEYRDLADARCCIERFL
jgi:hypothetical protein